MVEDLATFFADTIEFIVGGVLREPVDSRQEKVAALFDSDPDGWGLPRPEMMYVAELDADVVEKFSEA